MPYEWLDLNDTVPDPSGAVSVADARLHLRPHQSLTANGFVLFIGITAGLLALPLVAMIGSGVLWVLLAFLMSAFAGVWFAISRNRRTRSLHEELTFWPDRLHLTRRDPGQADRQWQANPHWVEVSLRPKGGPVPQYLTLRGGGREVEVGAFLTEGERVALHRELSDRLRDGQRSRPLR